jgi:hypothetical protein
MSSTTQLELLTELVGLQAFILLFASLVARSALRDRHYLRRNALVDPEQSPARKLLQSRDDSAYVDTLGFDCAAFDSLVQACAPWWADFREPALAGGRPPKVDLPLALFIVLMWLNSTCKQKTICLCVGLPPATVSRYIKIGLEMLRDSLRHVHDARIEFPSSEEMADLAIAASIRTGGELQGVWGVMDGLNMPVNAPTDNEDARDALYNGWLGGHFVSGVYVFRLDGAIAWYRTNCPGSWHDSEIVRPLYR